MIGKLLKVVFDGGLSVVVFFVMALITVKVCGLVLGTVTGSDGSETVNGGSLSAFIVLGVATVSAIIFAVFFYKFLNRKSKVTKV